jgi:spermidine synthase
MAKRWLLICFLAAFNGIAFQLSCFKALHLFLGNSTYSATVSLATYFSGILLGLYIYRRFHRSPTPSTAFVLGAGLVFSLYLGVVCFNYDLSFNLLYRGLALLHAERSFFGRIVFATLFLAVPTAANGTLYPLLYRFYSTHVAPGEEAFSRFFVIDTVAAIVAATAVGFVALPLFGLDWTLFAVALSALGAALLAHPPGAARALALAAVALTVSIEAHLHSSASERVQAVQNLIPSDSIIQANRFLDPNGGQIRTLFGRESPFGFVSVLEAPNGTRGMVLNRRLLCVATGRDARQVSESLIADDAGHALVGRGPGPRRLANIGLGCGGTLSTMLATPNAERVDVIEINPIVEVASHLFESLLGYQLSDGRIHLTLMDAFDYFRDAPERYDAVVMDVEEPSITYSTALYTSEFFASVKKHLTPGAIFAIWNYPTTTPTDAYQAIVYQTLQLHFPYVYAKLYVDKAQDYHSIAIGLFASSEPLKPEDLRLADSDLSISYQLRAAHVEPNTLRNMSLLKEWRKKGGDLVWN